MTKRFRLAFRVTIGVVLICLPLADNLNSLDLISTTMGLVFLVLVVDLYGCTFAGESIWRDGRRCRYWADCPKKRRRALQEAMKSGNMVNVEEFAVDEKVFIPAT